MRRKILLAVDGSDQALEAVRYAGSIFPSQSTDIVLFNVGTGFPEVFWDMNRNPLYQTKKPEVMEWLADYQLGIGEFNEKSINILTEAGFPTDAVSVKTQTKKTGILKDIIQESYQGYNAVVAGRTGMSRLKDLFLRSMAYKLAEKVKHIPTIIVGGKPQSRKIMVAFDESDEAMRGISTVGFLTGDADPEITLCHCLTEPAKNHTSIGQVESTQEEMDWVEYKKNKFQPYMQDAQKRLTDLGVTADHIYPCYLCTKGETVQTIIDEARNNDFGTVVVGRREAVGFSEEFLGKRSSVQLIKSLDNMAIWVVS